MGGVAAILRWDGAPIADDELRRVAAASAHRGLDGTRFRGAASSGGSSSPAFAAAHLRFSTTERADDRQPLADTARGLIFVFDGRLDNRDDLLPRLDLCDANIPDAAVALEAFGRWGAAAA